MSAEVVSYVLNAVLLVVVAAASLIWQKYLPAYMDQKGKNLATKEDLEALTRPVEAIRHEFGIMRERERAGLTFQSAAAGTLIDNEIREYRQVWEGALDLAHEWTDILRASLMGGGSFAEVSAGIETYRKSNRRRAPFISGEVEVSAAQFADVLEAAIAELDRPTEASLRAGIIEGVGKKVNEAMEDLELIIKARIYPAMWSELPENWRELQTYFRRHGSLPNPSE